MEFVVKEGNYGIMGAIVSGTDVVFTFQGEKEDVCYIVLVDKITREQEKIFVPNEYCMGSLRSIAIKIAKPGKYLYEYEINGKAVLDPYAHAIVGREKWNDMTRKDSDYKVYGAITCENWTTEQRGARQALFWR